MKYIKRKVPFIIILLFTTLFFIVAFGMLHARGDGNFISQNKYFVANVPPTPIRRISVPYNRNNVPSNMPFTQETGFYPMFDMDELISMSSLVVRGTVAGVSYPFFIENVFGNQQLFTEYYVYVHEILRGETSTNEVTVRLRGGVTRAHAHVFECNPTFTIGGEYLLFLTVPIGGSFDTLGYYYYLTIGGRQSVFRQAAPLHEIEAFSDEQDGIFVQYERIIPDSIRISEFRNDVATINELIPAPTAQCLRQKSADAVMGNVERGILIMSDYELEEWIDEILNPFIHLEARIVLVE